MTAEETAETAERDYVTGLLAESANRRRRKHGRESPNQWRRTHFVESRLVEPQSLTEKTGAVYETIDDNELDVLVLTETWHRSSDDIALRLAAPADFVAVDAVRESNPGYGGVAFFHRKRISLYQDCSTKAVVVRGTMHTSVSRW